MKKTEGKDKEKKQYRGTTKADDIHWCHKNEQNTTGMDKKEKTHENILWCICKE